MEFFVILSVIAILIGGLLAWFTKGSFARLALWCAISTLTFGAVVNLMLAGPPASFSAKYLSTAVVYFAWPWLLFLFLPSLITATLVFFLKGRQTDQ